MRKFDILVDTHYGDNGKARVIDYLVSKNFYSAVARWSGGANAGHTIVTDDGVKTVLNLLPSAVLNPNVHLYLGAQMVIDLDKLQQEISDLEVSGIKILDRLFISNRAHIVQKDHKDRDATHENKLGLDKIGTTKKGIGPCYSDKMARVGTRLKDLYLTEYSFRDRIFENVEIAEMLNREERVLCEGAQGYKLDIDHGDYPYVTSSNTIAASACVSLGLSPRKIEHIFGVTKAYCTRVGNGPFPSEFKNGEFGNKLREAGNEYGSTTGRPRRVGWLDLDILKEAVMMNGITDLILTKADVLSIYEHVFYIKDGQLESIKGWGDLSNCEYQHNLPESLMQFVDIIENYVGADIRYISVGAERNKIYFCWS